MIVFFLFLSIGLEILLTPTPIVDNNGRKRAALVIS